MGSTIDRILKGQCHVLHEAFRKKLAILENSTQRFVPNPILLHANAFLGTLVRQDNFLEHSGMVSAKKVTDF